jgi:predicted nucleic acid-binding protein
VSAWYLDSSAIVKFAVEEQESAALATWRAGLGAEAVLFTCELALTEVLRAVRRVGGDAATALAHLDALDQLVMDRDLLLEAGQLEPGGLRSLDSIHLAAAQAARADLSGVVTYDDRMAGAARILGIETLSPGR